MSGRTLLADMTEKMRLRFENFYEPSPVSGCWIWIHETNPKGYGRYRGNQAHRLSYEMHVGPIPDGLTLDHLCRNRLCVNPAHLEPVTNRENILRGTGPSAIAATRRACSRGHPYTAVRRAGRQRVCRPCDATRKRREHMEEVSSGRR